MRSAQRKLVPSSWLRSQTSSGTDMSTSSNPNTVCAAFIASSVCSSAGNTSSTSHTATCDSRRGSRAGGWRADARRRPRLDVGRRRAQRHARVARVDDRHRPVDQLAVQRVVDGDARLARRLADRQTLRQRPVEVLRERRGRGIEHAVLVGDQRRQAVRDQRLRDALVEVGAAAAAALARVQEHQAEPALAEDLAHRALAEHVLAAPLVLEDQAALAALLVVHAVPDEVHDLVGCPRDR